MAATTSRKKSKASNQEPVEVSFVCRHCGRERPLAEMRSVTRFVPVLVVCEDCHRKLR